jgi:hypothetical protein
VEEEDPATAVLIASIIGASTAVGTTAFNAANQPGSGPTQPTPAQLTEQSTQAVNSEAANRTIATKQAAQFLPGIESNSPGVSPDYLQNTSATFSGNANLAQSPEMQQMIAKFLGLDNGASFGSSTPFGSGSSGSSSNPNPLSPGLTG